MSLQPFVDSVRKHFAFLETELCYAVTDPKPGTIEAVHYERNGIYVDLGWYKGEIDVLIGTKIDTTVLRPFVSKSFNLEAIVKHQNPEALQSVPRFPGYVTKLEQADQVLEAYAKLLKTYGDEILRGDLKMLEVLSAKRN